LIERTGGQVVRDRGTTMGQDVGREKAGIEREKVGAGKDVEREGDRMEGKPC